MKRIFLFLLICVSIVFGQYVRPNTSRTPLSTDVQMLTDQDGADWKQSLNQIFTASLDATFDDVTVDELTLDSLYCDSASISWLQIRANLVPDANNGASIGSAALQFLGFYARHIDGDTVFVGVWGQNIDANQKMITDLGTLATDSVISNSGNLKLSGVGAGIVENTDSLQIDLFILPDATNGASIGVSGTQFANIYGRHIDGDTTFVNIFGGNIDADQKNITDLNKIAVDSVISNSGNLILNGYGTGYVSIPDTLLVNDISSASAIEVRASGDNDDYIDVSTTTNLPQIRGVGGTDKTDALKITVDDGNILISAGDTVKIDKPFTVKSGTSDNFNVFSSGNISINGGTFGATAAKVLSIGSGTAPTAVVADAAQLWVGDVLGVAGAAGLNVMGESGKRFTFGGGRIYQFGSFTDNSNYEGSYLQSDGAGNITLSGVTAGTGTDNINILLTPVGTGYLKSNSNYLGVNATPTTQFPIYLNPTATNAVNDYMAGIYLSPTITGYDAKNIYSFFNIPMMTVNATSGDVALAGTANFYEPQITKTGANNITSAFTMRIVNAPTEGISNYALWVDDGITRLDGALGETGNRVSKGWFTAVEVTSAAGLTVNGSQINSDALSDVASIGMLDENEEVTGAWTFNNAGGLQIGKAGQSGLLKLYSEQGATDFTMSMYPNTAMTSAASFYWPADEPAGTYLLNMTTGGVMGFDATDYQEEDATIDALAGLTIQDVSIIEGTGADAFNVVVSGGANYMLASDGTNAALSFIAPATVLSNIGAQASDATLTDIADGTIAEDLVNTANPWADNEVANNLTVDDAGIASTITRDTEWDTFIEINAASTDADAILTNSTWTGGDLGGTGLAATVTDDSHAHGTTTISGLDFGDDITNGAAIESISGLTEADVSILEATADNVYGVVTSGGNNYILGSNSGNTALEFKASTGTGSVVLNDAPTFTGLIKRSVTAGITASTTQSQGQQPLTSDINEVSVVGNANDVVTLPTAVAGMEVFIINNGANTLQIFPASGDNLGAGVNTSTTLNSASNITFVSYDATNWEVK